MAALDWVQGVGDRCISNSYSFRFVYDDGIVALGVMNAPTQKVVLAHPTDRYRKKRVKEVCLNSFKGAYLRVVY